MKFCLTIVAWGDWHLDQLETHGLPSLRAPGNLDEIYYRISAWTRPADEARLSLLLSGLKADVKFTLHDDVKGDQATANSTVQACNVWDRTVAAKNREAWGLVAPDMVWGEGAWAHHRYALEHGKRAVFRPLLRVDSSKTGTIRDFSKRNLARLALECEHQTSKDFYRADGRQFSAHPEMIIWDAPGGLINRTTTADVQTCFPAAVELNGVGLPRYSLKDSMEVVTDSDQMIALAMAAPDKTFLFRGNKPLSIDGVRGFLRTFPSPACRYVAQHSYRLHDRDIDFSAWEEPERRAQEFIDRVFSDAVG